MLRRVLIGKIHRAKVTGADLNYTGSIEIDENLMDTANIIESEFVEIYNITNGERFSTYVIKGERGSGNIVLNGAAARKVQKDDLVIIVNYGMLNDDEIKNHQPSIIFVDANNQIVRK